MNIMSVDLSCVKRVFIPLYKVQSSEFSRTPPHSSEALDTLDRERYRDTKYLDGSELS